MKPRFIQLRMGLRVSLRKSDDCILCKNYLYRDNISSCKKKYLIVNWESEVNILSDDFDFELDDDFGSYRVDENNNRIQCNDFKLKVKGDRTKTWRKKKYGKSGSKISPDEI